MGNYNNMDALRLCAVRLAADIANLKKEFSMELCFDKDLQDELRRLQTALRDCAAVALAAKAGRTA